MARLLKRLFRSCKGATAVEYGLICALIVLGAMTAITGFGVKVMDMWNDIRNEVVGP